jgi:hypothetical protein
MDSHVAHHGVDALDVVDETLQEGLAVCEIVNKSHDAVFRHRHILALDPLM